MQQKKFKVNDKFYEAIKKGIKTATTRLDDKEVEMGDEIQLIFPNHPPLIAMVEYVYTWDIECMSEDYRKFISEAEGYTDFSMLQGELEEIYGDIGDEVLCTIKFRSI